MKLYNGDCEEILKNLTEEVNLIFTSPPYYNAREYVNYESYDVYLEKMTRCFTECSKVLQDGRYCVVNVSPVIKPRENRSKSSIRYPIPFDFHKVLTNSGFVYVDDIVWIKPESSVPNRNGVFQQNGKPLAWKPNCITESLLVYRKKCDFLIDRYVKNYNEVEEDKYEESSNVWYISPSKSKKHPAVFPEELVERVLRYYSLKNDIVLDPFAGIGTTGKVCRRMGRDFIGIEQNEVYFNEMSELLK